MLKIEISDNRLECLIGDYKLKVGDRMTYMNYEGKSVKGMVIAFAIVDKKDMKSPWCYTYDPLRKENCWFPLRAWSMKPHIKFTEMSKDEVDDLEGLFTQQKREEAHNGDSFF